MSALLSLLRYLRGSLVPVTISFILLMASTGLGLVSPWLTQHAIDGGIAARDVNFLWWSVAGILGSSVVSAAFGLLSGYALIQSSQGFGYRLRNAVYRVIMAFSFGNLDHWRTGELMVRLNSDVNVVRMFVRMGLFMIVQSILMITGALIAMFLTDTGLALVMTAIIPTLMLLFLLVATKIRPLFMKLRKALDHMNNVIQENLAGAKVVRAFGRQDEEIRKFDEKNQANYDLSIQLGYRINPAFSFFFTIGNLVVLTAWWVGGTTLITQTPATGAMTLGKLMAFMNYAGFATFSILMLGMVLNFISSAMASAVRLQEVLDEKPAIQEKQNALSLPRLKGAVEFRGVSFRYGSGEKALDDINLVIKPGEKLGIIGTTGAGKSSLISLIGRFYDPEQGHVLVDDIDVRDLSFSTVRSRIAVVLQEAVLFAGTIRENVAFGAPDITIPALEKAAEIACAKEFIDAKPLGWDEPIGERGTGLSGGQRQRIAIARAYAVDPDIIILDDVTSSLDLGTEQSIVDRLYKVFADKTAIIISQKINTIRRSDRIVVMEAGRIVAIGTHEELRKTNETYRTICETQLVAGAGGVAL